MNLPAKKHETMEMQTQATQVAHGSAVLGNADLTPFSPFYSPSVLADSAG